MELSMSISKSLAIAVAAIALVAASPVQAKPKLGKGLAILGAAIVVGTAIAASRDRAYAEEDCRVVERVNRYGEVRLVKICEID
jgi:hypothetical protein